MDGFHAVETMEDGGIFGVTGRYPKPERTKKGALPKSIKCVSTKLIAAMAIGGASGLLFVEVV